MDSALIATRLYFAAILGSSLAACAHEPLPPRSPSPEQQAAAAAMANKGYCAPGDVVIRNVFTVDDGRWVKWDAYCRAPAMPRVRCQVYEGAKDSHCVPLKEDSP